MSQTYIELYSKALMMKKKSPITEEEKTKIVSLGLLYGTDVLLIAIHGAKSADLGQIGRVCMQVSGFLNSVPELLDGIIISRQEARQKFPSEAIEVADRLRKVRTNLDVVELIRISTDSNGKSAFDLWKEKTGNYEEESIWVARDLLRNFGPELVRWCIPYTPSPPYPENEPKLYTKEFLYYASLKNVEKLNELLQLAHIPKTISSEAQIPKPRNIKLNRYFWAKTGRIPSDEESFIIWKLNLDHIEKDIILDLTRTPSHDFSFAQFQKRVEHYYHKPKLPVECSYRHGGTNE